MLVCQIVVHVKCQTYIVFSLINGYMIIIQTSIADCTLTACVAVSRVFAVTFAYELRHLDVIDV